MLERSPPLVTDGELDVVLREECTDVYKVKKITVLKKYISGRRDGDRV